MNGNKLNVSIIKSQKKKIYISRRINKYDIIVKRNYFFFQQHGLFDK